MRKPSLERQNDKVAIVGMGIGHDAAPWNDTSFDLYALNAAHRTVPAHAASLWFQIHRPGSGEGHIDEQDHIDWLQTWGGCPILMCEKYEWVPKSVPFPIEETTTNCGPGYHYYGSTIDYMMAYALWQNYDEIHLFGVSMAGDDYQKRKESLTWYLGVAFARGVKLSIQPTSSLLKQPRVYGFEPEPKQNKKLIADIGQSMEDCEREQMEYQRRYMESFGRMRAAEGRREGYAAVRELIALRDRNNSQV